MALLQDGRSAAGLVAVETKTKSLRFTNAPRGNGYSISGTSGTIAAAQAALSCFWSIRINPASTSLLVFVEKLRVQYTTIGAYTVPVTSGRRLSVFRGTGAAASGGTTLSPSQKDSTVAVSQTASSNGGDSRISTTTALGVTGITWEANPFREMSIAHVGTAGGNNEDIYDFNTTSPIILQPGQILGLRNPQAMDAGGTFIVSVDVDIHESVAWSSTVID